MRVLVTIGYHFWRGPDGWVYPEPPATFDYAFWLGYAEVFDEVLVLARVRDVSSLPPPYLRADGPGVRFIPLPDFRGPWRSLRRLPILKRLVRNAVRSHSAFILRVPDLVGFVAWQEIRRMRKPFAVEVISDPWEAFARGGLKSCLRPVVRRVWTRNLRRMCADASAACYVTRDALQRRYPPKAGSLAFAISSVRIPRESFADGALLEARLGGLAEMTSEGARRQTPFRLGFMGMMEHLYKAPDIVLRAVAICARQGLNVTLDMVGDGGCRPGLGRLAARLGIARIVRFLGALEPGASVFGFLDSIDLFVLPSRVEGLPRAMIEAMARGCPCIGSSVGGVPELLSAEDLVPPGDVAALARKITDVLSDTERMACMAVRNWKASKEYLPEVLGPRRQAFYHKVRELAEKSATSRCSY